MNFAFPWPYSQGEWLAWGVAAFTLLLGLVAIFAPRWLLHALKLQVAQGHEEGLAVARAQLGGFYIGIGAAAILFAQPLIYMTLGLAWALAALARLVSLISDRSTIAGWVAFAASLVLAAFPLAFVFGFVR